MESKNEEHVQKVENVKSLLRILLEPSSSHEWDVGEFQKKIKKDGKSLSSMIGAMDIVDNILDVENIRHQNDVNNGVMSFTDKFIHEMAELAVRMHDNLAKEDFD